MNGTNNWFPVIMRSEDTKSFYGILPDLAETISAETGIPVAIQPQVPWKHLFLQLDQGELDVIMGVYWTSERASKYHYSKPVLQDEVAIFVRKGREFPVNRLDDLIGRVGLRPQGGSYGESFDSFARDHLIFRHVPSSDVNQIMRMLANDAADYAVLGRYDGLEDIRDGGFQSVITDLPWPVTSNGVHYLFGANSGCADMVHEFDRLIGEMLKNGTIRAIEEKYVAG